ncbi:uncharacterized protein EI90DRAFT_3294530 [Cantharellus anzutake]|uniref:uncharacterized protein n=1 Tax=Cantharellus anzutake TaxID=1750568 RepID=UPI001908F1F5|nr:uncharacterized protein EI90DRAFT_3294530 [Cantharellus anzutake]KAF8313291.1 hypothetical protein EI90DRAFT_3294530 [Cantharellus anzutake]
MGRRRKHNTILTNWATDSLSLTRSGAVARKKARLTVGDAHEQLMKATPRVVIDGLSEIQDGGVAPGDFLDDWYDEPGRDELNLVDDVGLDFEQLRKLISRLAPKPRRKGHEWSTRMSRLHAQWMEQLDTLTSLYLQIKTSNSSCVPVHYPEPQPGSNWIEIQCIDIFAPNFSIQNYSRLLADMHRTVFQPHLRTQISLAFDVYYCILSRLRAMVQQKLGHDTPDHRLKTSCPACHHKVEDEPELPIQFIVTGDGNTSLSRLRHHFEGDSRIFFSDYYISRGDVDQFASARKRSQPSASSQPLYSTITGGPYSTDDRGPTHIGGLPSLEECPTNAIKVKVRSFAGYGRNRHGIMQFLLDMVQSGELAKYPLASAEKLIRTFGKNILFAYDIACTFSATLSKSSIGALARDANFRCCTGSFHGAAHDRSCQLDFLITLQNGAGIEDGEGNERVYSESNALAPIIRHASPYHRHQRIHIHFSKWDEIKYEKLGASLLCDFLLNNFKSATKIISDGTTVLDQTQVLFPDFDADHDCPQWLSEERDYISSLQLEPTDEKVKIEYLEAIEHLEHAEATTRYWTLQIGMPAALSAQFGQHVAQAIDTLETARSAVMAIEARSLFILPWTSDSPQRLEAIVLRQQRDYHHILDELEQRAISRQLELEKIGLPKTDYKTRQHISTLDVTDLHFLSDIILLRGREDIRDKRWFQRHFRDATRAWYKLQHAREEVKIVGIEAHRIWASVIEEEAHLRQVIETTQHTHPELAKYISLMAECRLNANRQLRRKLKLLEKQGGVSTPLPAIRRVGSPGPIEDMNQANVSTSEFTANNNSSTTQTVSDPIAELQEKGTKKQWAKLVKIDFDDVDDGDGNDNASEDDAGNRTAPKCW